jgi:hypothetical protein
VGFKRLSEIVGNNSQQSRSQDRVPNPADPGNNSVELSTESTCSGLVSSLALDVCTLLVVVKATVK